MFILETITGTHYEMGVQHGRAFRHLIVANVHRWAMRHTFQATEAEMDAALDASRRADEHFAPWAFEELRGISEGCGVELPWLVRMQLRVWNRVPHQPYPGDGCTGIGMLTEEQGVVVGGTLDDPREPYVLIRRIPSRGIPHVMICWAGTAWGHNGLNEAGLAVAQASLGWFEPDLKLAKEPSASPGTAGRMILENCRTVAEALTLLQRLRPATSFILGDRDGTLRIFQGLGPHQAVAEPRNGMVFVTNHICLPGLLAEGQRQGCRPGVTDYSRVRFETLTRARESQPRTVTEMERLLQSHDGYPHSICNDSTVMASIATPVDGRIRIADRAPCRNPFVPFQVHAV